MTFGSTAARTSRLCAALTAALGLAALSGCAPAPAPGAAAPNQAGTAYAQHLAADQVDTWRGMHYNGLVLDVRDLPEWDDDLSHLADAVIIPIEELAGRIEEIGRYRSLPVLVYDRTGTRSIRAGQALVTNGFHDVTILDGGLKAYRDWQGKAP